MNVNKYSLPVIKQLDVPVTPGIVSGPIWNPKSEVIGSAFIAGMQDFKYNSTAEPRLVFRDDHGKVMVYDTILYDSIMCEVTP